MRAEDECDVSVTPDRPIDRIYSLDDRQGARINVHHLLTLDGS
jgi:hypothetical protein